MINNIFCLFLTAKLNEDSKKPSDDKVVIKNSEQINDDGKVFFNNYY